MAGEGGRFSSGGTRVPSPRPVPQGAAPPAERWRADAGVNIAALETAASHHALAGDRQEAGQETRNAARTLSYVTPRGRAASKTRPRRTTRGQCRAPGCGRGPSGSTVERVGSSDMLPRLNCLGIPRGFAFSATCNRRCLPAAEATAIGRSRGIGGLARGPGARTRTRSGMVLQRTWSWSSSRRRAVAPAAASPRRTLHGGTQIGTPRRDGRCDSARADPGRSRHAPCSDR